MHIGHCKVNSVLILKDFSNDIGGDVNVMFKTPCNQMRPLVQRPSQRFLSAQHPMLRNYPQVSGALRVRGTPKDFSVTENTRLFTRFQLPHREKL